VLGPQPGSGRPQPGGGWPPPGYQPPRRARPTRPPEPAARQRAIAAFILGIISLLSFFGIGTNFHRGIYLVVFALAVGAAACWLGIATLRQARRADTMRPRGAVAGIVLGALSAAFSVLLLSVFALFWNQFSAFSRCWSNAQTVSAQQACLTHLNRSLNTKIGLIGSQR
jgi:hypothetical protein